MHSKSLCSLVVAALLIIGAGASVFADTIRLRDGSVLRGEIIAFADQQFTILVGQGARGRRSRITIYMEDVESIVFERAVTSAGDAPTASSPAPSSTSATPGDRGGRNEDSTGEVTAVGNVLNTGAGRGDVANVPPRTPGESATSPVVNNGSARNTPGNPTPPSSSSSRGTLNYREASVRVRADATTNGWTNSGVIVKRGQRIRVSASGRIALGQGRFSTPAGVATIDDEAKLMRSEATGGLIAVVGDNNDDFIFIGNRREFVAQRDGVLFLGVNEGNLNDNTGTYDVTISYEN